MMYKKISYKNASFSEKPSDCPGQQRVNFYSFSSLLWGCVVYSCLSCLRLSSTSPAIEPSSPPPPTDPLRKHILPASGSTSPPSSQMKRREQEGRGGKAGVKRKKKCHVPLIMAAVWCYNLQK